MITFDDWEEIGTGLWKMLMASDDGTPPGTAIGIWLEMAYQIGYDRCDTLTEAKETSATILQAWAAKAVAVSGGNN